MHELVKRGRNVGSAAMLVGRQKLVFVFVDDDGANPWTEELRLPVEAKIGSGLRWLEDQARSRGIALYIENAFLPNRPSQAVHAGARIDETDYAAGPGHSTWQNTIAARTTRHRRLSEGWSDLFAMASLPLTGAEGSAIFFCVRRWVPSVAFRFFNGEHQEFFSERGIIYDNGGPNGQWYLASLVAHEVLHLYGAVDLAPGKVHESIALYAEQHRDDVMHTPTQRPVDQYQISDLTAYLVGWTDQEPATDSQANR